LIFQQLSQSTLPLNPVPSEKAAASISFPTASAARNSPASRLGLCRDHYDASAAIGASLQQDQSDFTDLSAELLPELSEFTAGTDIRQFLARLLTLVAKGRISPRRASVLAFISSQLLHSHRAITLETKPAEEETRIIIDMPRPDRDWPEPEAAPPTPPMRISAHDPTLPSRFLVIPL
jgi:hypothetical protein